MGRLGHDATSADLRAAVGSQFVLQIKKPPDVPDELKEVIASSVQVSRLPRDTPTP